jgi:hypothetical protein
MVLEWRLTARKYRHCSRALRPPNRFSPVNKRHALRPRFGLRNVDLNSPRPGGYQVRALALSVSLVFCSSSSSLAAQVG